MEKAIFFTVILMLCFVAQFFAQPTHLLNGKSCLEEALISWTDNILQVPYFSGSPP